MVLELDQYSDGKAARLWKLYIGDMSERTSHYKEFLKRELNGHDCNSVLDVACGTGVDSVMLIEEGYRVTSCDFSDKMLKVALRTRWDRRREPAFDSWEIHEANWLTLPQDLDSGVQYDAVICLGNSFAHLPDLTGDQESHRLALRNFASMVKPGGILLIDHRNYDFILDNGRAPSRNIYYNSRYVSDIKTSVIYQEGAPKKIILDYTMGAPSTSSTDVVDNASRRDSLAIRADPRENAFTLSYYPHRMEAFRELLMEAFDHQAEIETLGDFQPLGQLEDPAFFIHVVRKFGGSSRHGMSCSEPDEAATSSGEESI